MTAITGWERSMARLGLTEVCCRKRNSTTTAGRTEWGQATTRPGRAGRAGPSTSGPWSWSSDTPNIWNIWNFDKLRSEDVRPVTRRPLLACCCPTSHWSHWAVRPAGMAAHWRHCGDSRDWSGKFYLSYNWQTFVRKVKASEFEHVKTVVTCKLTVLTLH